jgi:hypothetical protein
MKEKTLQLIPQKYGELITDYYEQFYANKLDTLNRMEKVLNSFYEASIILVTKPDQDTKRKESHRPTSPVIIHAKLLNKMLMN